MQQLNGLMLQLLASLQSSKKQRERVKLNSSQVGFGSSLFLFGKAWISPGYYFPEFHLVLQFHCTDNKNSCMPAIPVHVNVTTKLVTGIYEQGSHLSFPSVQAEIS